MSNCGSTSENMSAAGSNAQGYCDGNATVSGTTQVIPNEQVQRLFAQFCSYFSFMDPSGANSEMHLLPPAAHHMPQAMMSTFCAASNR